MTRTRQYYLASSKLDCEPVVKGQSKRHNLNPLTVELNVSLHYLSTIAISISAIYARVYSPAHPPGQVYTPHQYFTISYLTLGRLFLAARCDVLHCPLRGHHHRGPLAHL